MKLLFVCGRNRRRSPTAETVFGRYPNVEALSAGIGPDAETPVSADLIGWADLVLAMESSHRRLLNKRFGPLLKGKKIAVLGIDDKYEYMDTELVRTLQAKGPSVSESWGSWRGLKVSLIRAASNCKRALDR